MPVSPWKAPQTDTSPPTPSLWEVDVREQPAQPAHVPAGDAGPAAGPVMRDKTLVIRLTEEEREAWHDAAACAGRGKTAAWVRDLVSGWIAAGATLRVEDENKTERDRWRREFARLGNNLNQLTRAVHVAQLDGTAVGFQVGQELERLTRETRRLREAVERSVQQ